MTDYFDANAIKKARFSKWHWLWLWAVPTAMSVDYNPENGAETACYFKYAFGKIWVVGFKTIYT